MRLQTAPLRKSSLQACLITDPQQWNDFVAKSPYCSITQSYEWGELAPSIGAKALHIGVVNETGDLCAAMLVFVTHLPVLHNTFLYAPRGPIIDDPASPAMAALLSFVRIQAQRLGAFMLKVEPGAAYNAPEWLSALRRQGFQVNPCPLHVRSEWILDIRPEEKDLLAGMKEKWRYNIRLATRKGVQIRRGEGPADMATFYRIHQQTSERDRFFIHNQAHYETIMRLYREGDRAALFLAEYEGKPIAGTIVLCFGHWSWYMYGASSNEHRKVMPNHLLQWTGIQWARAHGCWYYNFRGIPDVLEEGQELWGVYQFKQGFGGYAMHSLASHDLVYRPVTYRIYRSLLDLRHRRNAKNNQLLDEAEQRKSTGDLHLLV